MAKDQNEWFRQADYDMESARVLAEGGRSVYAVFMCHLALEKALKGHFFKKFQKQAPKIHNLWTLVEAVDLKPPETMAEFVVALNQQSIVTRYPEDIRKIGRLYNKKNTALVLKQSMETLQWLREKL